MTHTQTITPKKRINSIDALRGFALIGIMLLHCMERFDLTLAPVVESPFWQAIDTAVYDSLYFLFSGKSASVGGFDFTPRPRAWARLPPCGTAPQSS